MMADVWVMYPTGGASGQAITEERWRAIHRTSFPGGVAGPEDSFRVNYDPADRDHVTLHGGYLWIDGMFVEYVGGTKAGLGTMPWDYTQKIAAPTSGVGAAITYALLYVKVDLAANPPVGSFAWTTAAAPPLAPEDIDHPNVSNIPLALVKVGPSGTPLVQEVHDRRLWSPARRDIIYVDSMQQAELDPHDRRVGQLYVDQENGQIYVRREDGVLFITQMHDPRTGGPPLGGVVSSPLVFPGTQGKASARLTAHADGTGGVTLSVVDTAGSEGIAMTAVPGSVSTWLQSAFLNGLSVKDGFSGPEVFSVTPKGVVTIADAAGPHQPAAVTALDPATRQIAVQGQDIGDTGWRIATGWCTGLDPAIPGQLLVRRVGATVTLKFNNLKAAANAPTPATLANGTIPTGFTASGIVVAPLAISTDPTASELVRVEGGSIHVQLREAVTPQAQWHVDEALSGQISYITDDPWPVTLP